MTVNMCTNDTYIYVHIAIHVAYAHIVGGSILGSDGQKVALIEENVHIHVEGLAQLYIYTSNTRVHPSISIDGMFCMIVCASALAGVLE